MSGQGEHQACTRGPTFVRVEQETTIESEDVNAERLTGQPAIGR